MIHRKEVKEDRWFEVDSDSFHLQITFLLLSYQQLPRLSLLPLLSVQIFLSFPPSFWSRHYCLSLPTLSFFSSPLWNPFLKLIYSQPSITLPPHSSWLLLPSVTTHFHSRNPRPTISKMRRLVFPMLQRPILPLNEIPQLNRPTIMTTPTLGSSKGIPEPNSEW